MSGNVLPPPHQVPKGDLIEVPSVAPALPLADVVLDDLVERLGNGSEVGVRTESGRDWVGAPGGAKKEYSKFPAEI